jgi:hypothetical protein
MSLLFNEPAIAYYEHSKILTVETFLTLGQAQCYKTFSARDLRIFVLSCSVCQTRLEKLKMTNTLTYYENP